MALILNIETATTVCSVALARDGQLLALKELNNGFTHAENLTVFIEELINKVKIKFADLDAIAVSKGPGSYTGLRIGVSTAKGLCYGLGKPLIAVSTLKSLTFQVQNSKFKVQDSGKSNLDVLFCPMLDARRMEVYCALYDKERNEIEPIQAKIIDEHAFQEHVKSNVVYFFGDGAPKCFEILQVNKNAVFVENIVPSAGSMVSFSESAFNAKQFEDVAYFEPYYLKNFIAGPKKVT